jgi:hypothetical protein
MLQTEDEHDMSTLMEEAILVLDENKPMYTLLKEDNSVKNVIRTIRCLTALHDHPTLSHKLRGEKSLEFFRYALGYWHTEYALVDFIKRFSTDDQEIVLTDLILLIRTGIHCPAMKVLALLALPSNIEYIRSKGAVKLLTRTFVVRMEYQPVKRASKALQRLIKKDLIVHSDEVIEAAIKAINLGAVHNPLKAYNMRGGQSWNTIRNQDHAMLHYLRTITAVCPLLELLRFDDVTSIESRLNSEFASIMEAVLKMEKQMEKEYLENKRKYPEGLVVLEQTYQGHDLQTRLMYASELVAAISAMNCVDPIRHYLERNEKIQDMMRNEENIPTKVITKFRYLRRKCKTINIVKTLFDVVIVR